MAGRPKPAQDPAITKLVDELVDLDGKITPEIKQKIARADLVRKALRQHYQDKQADAYFTAEGTVKNVLLGPKANEKKINVALTAKKLGAAVFARIASVTLKALEAEAPHIMSDVITIEATGTRDLTITPKAA